MAKALMIQGAGSNVGKSMFVAGLARVLAQRGMNVAPFKPQNMSNNAAVTSDGGEIGRAQSLQARAAGKAPLVHMNPILLKPETDVGAQVIVQGQRYATLAAKDYGTHKAQLLPYVMDSYARISKDADIVLVEGAGSPAEVNLRAGDIANMGFAEAADIPVMLVGDIDRGGVIAQLVGTHAVLPKPDRERIKAFAINKFRGDVSLFAEGASAITRHTDWPSAGVLPWFADAWRLPAEDIMDIRSKTTGTLKIAIPKLNRIANFDDLDPLSSEPDVSVEIIEQGRPLPGDADLVLIPGSKSTIGDLIHFRQMGWDIDLAAHIRRGGHVLGLCGGYQMLGKRINDPHRIEGNVETIEGLGHLDIETTMHPEKHVKNVTGQARDTGLPVTGYEIHIGETTGPDCENAWLEIEGAASGAQSINGRVRGCYVHGIFAENGFRSNYLQRIGGQSSQADFETGIDETLDKLAAHMARHLDIEKLLKIAN